MFPINNPPTWLARALRIITGGAGLSASDEIVQVVDVMQEGWGMASFGQQTVQPAVGVGAVTTLTTDETEQLFVKLSHTNTGTANVLLTVRAGINGLVPLIEFIANTPAASSVSWGTIGAGREWFRIPPNGRMEITQGASTTNPDVLTIFTARLPAGVAMA